MSKIDFSDCKKCPIRRECKECGIKDLTCEELYKVLKADGQTLSNADRIRQMTDEQLAEFLASLMPQSCGSCRLQDPDLIPMFHCRVDCETAWIDWLRDYDRHFWGRRERLKDTRNSLEDGKT